MSFCVTPVADKKRQVGKTAAFSVEWPFVSGEYDLEDKVAQNSKHTYQVNTRFKRNRYFWCVNNI